MQSIRPFFLLTTTADVFFSKLGYQVVDRASASAEVYATAEFQSMSNKRSLHVEKDLT